MSHPSFSRSRGSLYAPPAQEAEARSPRPWLSPRRRIQIIFGLFLFVGLFLAGQLLRYQLFGPPPKPINPMAAPTKQRLRGHIVDAQGHPLAIQSFRYELVASPDAMDEADMRLAANKLAPLLETTPEALLAQFLQYKDRKYLLLSSSIPPEAGEALLADKKLYGVGVYIYPQRFHPEKTMAAHLLGFVNVDNEGHYGVEEYFNSFLLAPTSHIRPQPDPKLEKALGQIDQNAVVPNSPFIPSPARRDLILTIQRAFQYVAETRLEQALEKYQADSGVVIILDPQTSAVLAMASRPTYDPDAYPDYPPETYVNPAISQIYEPGSVLKLITFAAALEKGIITPETVYQDDDSFTYGEQTIRNWDRKGRGKVTAQQALAQSLNVTTAKIAVDVGKEDFYKTLTRFGFGVNSGIELAYEAPGIVHRPGTATWAPGYLATNSFGQAISVTPLQVANAVAAIASGGVLHRPHVVRMSIKNDVIRVKESEPVSRAISPQTARTLTQMMVAAANHTKAATIPGYAIAGKTGTAEIPGLGGYKEARTEVTFVGFFPADAPQFLILVKLDRPKTSAWASKTAAPTFKAIAQDIIRITGLPPDDIRLHSAP